MSKKDYELIAGAIRKCEIAPVDRQRIALALAWALHEHDNIRFNPNKFILACMAKEST